MNITKTLTLTLLLTTPALLACDTEQPGDVAEAKATRGLGELTLPVDLDPTSEAASTTPSLGVQTNAETEHETVGASVGLPSRKQDLIGWLQWSGALLYYAGPIFDETGEQCGEGQAGPVWYLPGTAGGAVSRSCTIPVGKQIVFPLLNYYSAVPDSYYTTPESKQAFLDYLAATSDFIFNDITCSLTAKLNGQDLYSDLTDTWVSVLEPFEVELPDDPDNFADWFGLVGGTTDAAGSGYYARTPPLPPGHHTLEFGGTLCFDGEIWFETHATYAIHVQ
jgi:hypothetical protein